MNRDLSERIRKEYERLAGILLNRLGPAGHWIGELSSSALSTAVATIAIGEVGRRQGSTDPADARLIERGLAWLADHRNSDGGWGDTLRSRSNLSTTALVWAAFGAAGAEARHPEAARGATRYLVERAGTLEKLVPAIESRYGDDRTFSVPIVLTLALSGRLGPEGWRQVRPLPFELAAFPRSWFGALRLPVVSYAMPALIALGQAIHHHAPSRQPLARWTRQLTRDLTLRRLISLQPPNGGFLEATPLTAFVAMSLASMGATSHPVTRRATAFLRASARPDGSWPIDTNLATWVTTLSVKALRFTPGVLSIEHRDRLTSWLLGQQLRETHPYTGAAPGGWAWTDLPGGVPDADDTAGTLLALHLLAPDSTRCLAAADLGVTWLLDLQNRDGGIPTFCRGWGRLPFDRSAPELTAHALRAWTAWAPQLSAEQQQAIARATRRARRFLRRSQRPNGSWLPLWFGNEHVADDVNPVYGTSQVLTALGEPGLIDPESSAGAERARRFLLGAQGTSGGWGGDAGVPPTLEESSLALHALATGDRPTPEVTAALERGAGWLLERLAEQPEPAPSPIGLYFARLWYFESLYPLAFATEALGALVRNQPPPPSPP